MNTHCHTLMDTHTLIEVYSCELANIHTLYTLASCGYSSDCFHGNMIINKEQEAYVNNFGANFNI